MSSLLSVQGCKYTLDSTVKVLKLLIDSGALCQVKTKALMPDAFYKTISLLFKFLL